MHGGLGLVNFNDFLDALNVLKMLTPAVARTPGAQLGRRYDVEGDAGLLSAADDGVGDAGGRPLLRAGRCATVSIAVVRAEMMAPWSGDGAACAMIAPSTSSYRQASPKSC